MISPGRLPLVLVCLALLVCSGCSALAQRSWAWKEADLDRNRLDVGLYYGNDTAPELAAWVDHGEVVEATGGPATDDVLRMVVLYEGSRTPPMAGSARTERRCYLFTSADGYSVSFASTPCPEVAQDRVRSARAR